MGPAAGRKPIARSAHVMMAGTHYPGLEAVVFDLDGTLIDSIPDITRALAQTLALASLPPVSEAAVRGMVGHGARELVADAVAAAARGQSVSRSLDLVYDDYVAAYDAAPFVASRLYPGATELIDDLLSSGVRLGLCTNKPPSTTELILAALGLREKFGCVVGGTDDVPMKPAPDMLLTVLRELGAAPGASVMIGDSTADAGAAHAAGTRLVLMQHGYGGDKIANLSADGFAASFADVAPILRGAFAAPA